MTEKADFYEDDEPVEKIRAAFRRGEKGVTAPATVFVQVIRASRDFSGNSAEYKTESRGQLADVVPQAS